MKKRVMAGIVIAAMTVMSIPAFADSSATDTESSIASAVKSKFEQLKAKKHQVVSEIEKMVETGVNQLDKHLDKKDDKGDKKVGSDGEKLTKPDKEAGSDGERPMKPDKEVGSDGEKPTKPDKIIASDDIELKAEIADETDEDAISAIDYIKQLKQLYQEAGKGLKQEIRQEIAAVKQTIENSEIDVYIKGSNIDFSKYDNVMPIIKSDRVLVPIRAISEALGATVDWDEETQTITVTYNDTVIVLHLDQNTVTVDGKTVTIDVAPCLHKNRTVVPMRFLSETMGHHVDWDDSSKSVLIDEEDEAIEEVSEESESVEDTPDSDGSEEVVEESTGDSAEEITEEVTDDSVDVDAATDTSEALTE